MKSAVESLKEQQKPPIRHAGILAKSPLCVIQNITHHFTYNVLKKDSLNRYPIEVALKEGLEWNRELQQIIEAMTVAQKQLTSIYTAAQYGLKWTHHMKELAEKNTDELINVSDTSLTGLRLFMVAAMGEYHDLSGIYATMRMGPETNIQKC